MICNLIAVNTAVILVNHASNLVSDYLNKTQNCSNYHKLTQNNRFCDTNKYKHYNKLSVISLPKKKTNLNKDLKHYQSYLPYLLKKNCDTLWQPLQVIWSVIGVHSKNELCSHYDKLT